MSYGTDLFPEKRGRHVIVNLWNRKGIWFWHATGKDGLTIAGSAQGYESKRKCWNGLRSFLNAKKIQIEVFKGEWS